MIQTKIHLTRVLKYHSTKLLLNIIQQNYETFNSLIQLTINLFCGGLYLLSCMHDKWGGAPLFSFEWHILVRNKKISLKIVD